MKSRFYKPPLSKKDVRYREEKYNHLRKHKDYKENAQCLNRFNKKYRKIFDPTVPYQYFVDVKKYIEPMKIYKGKKYLINHGYFTLDYIGRYRIVPTIEVLEELFRREMCAFKDWTIWNNDRVRENFKKEKRKLKKKAAKRLERSRKRKLRKMLEKNK